MPQQTQRSDWPLAASASKPWTRWWWLGSAVDAPGLTAALEAYAQAGFGGVEVCPIYGAKGAEDRFVPFLSDRWVGLLDHVIAEASRRGMALDLTTGTGWPFGGTNVGMEQASCKVVFARHEVANGARLDERLPAGTFEHAVAVNAEQTTVAVAASGDRLRWNAPADGGPWTVVVAVRQSPIQKVKRAAPGGEGNVVDPYSTTSLDHYLAPFDAALGKLTGARPHGHFHDSFEYYGAEWTPAMLVEFERRRGYDLRPKLPALIGVGDADLVARVRCDFRQTIAELHLDYVTRWTEWCHRHDGLAREQAHGAPGNLIDLYAAADVPETELFGPIDENVRTMNAFASSAAHLAGRPIASAEAFTWLGEHFNVTLADAKAEADFLFLAGINRLVFHGIAYSPSDVAWPGWLFYASVHFGPMGGLWHDLPAFNAYLARCQSILQSGKPSRDLLLYFPVFDLWQTAAPKETTSPTFKPDAPQLLMPFGMHDDHVTSHAFHATSMGLTRGGYLFDHVSDHFLSTSRLADGRIEINGMRYATIVVPSCRVMPYDTLRRLLDLAGVGATIVFVGELPCQIPGLSERETLEPAMHRAVAPLAEGGGDRTIAIGAGRVIVSESLERALAAANATREPMADVGLLCERRVQDDGHAYFIVNRRENAVDRWIPLGTAAASATLLDPRSENRIGVAAVRQRDGRAEIYLQLAPGESVVVQTFLDGDAKGTPWRYSSPAGESRTLAGRWRVEFVAGGPALPSAFETDRLASWTEIAPHPEAKRFAGTAIYRIEFDHAAIAGIVDWALDLGRVCESARVRVNGHDAGVAWCPPFTLPVGEWLRAGRNVIEVEVTNLAANRIADLDRRGVEWKRFHEINFVNKDYKPFDASGWPSRDSGLIGPVRLVPMRAMTP